MNVHFTGQLCHDKLTLTIRLWNKIDKSIVSYIHDGRYVDVWHFAIWNITLFRREQFKIFFTFDLNSFVREIEQCRRILVKIFITIILFSGSKRHEGESIRVDRRTLNFNKCKSGCRVWTDNFRDFPFSKRNWSLGFRSLDNQN